MSHSRNSNSVQTELTDEDSDDDSDQIVNQKRSFGRLPNHYYPVASGSHHNKGKNFKKKGLTTSDEDDDDDGGEEEEEEDEESSISSSDSELDSFESEQDEEDVIEEDDDGNGTDNGESNDCKFIYDDDCELCRQAKACKEGKCNILLNMSNGSSTTTTTTTRDTTANYSDNSSSNNSNKCGSSYNNNNNNQVQCNLSDTVKCNRYPVKHWMSLGKTVFVRWTNGLYYLGVIEKIEDDKGLCLIRYEDNSQYWTHFKDIHIQLSTNMILSDSDIICSECRDGSSKSPNEIVICDVCNQGYHQLCHKPNIPDYVLEPDAPWTCRTCIYALGARAGGAERNTAIGEAMKLTKTILHYDLSSLTWNDSHQANRENIYCYCGGPGRYHSRMLQCHKCLQWFHEACIQVINAPFFLGDHFYQFTCGVCSDNGQESIKRSTMRWSDMIAIVLYNLTLKHHRAYFDFSTEIVPLIVKNSSKFKTKGCSLQRLSEEELTRKVLSVLVKYKKKFICNKDRKKLWALRVPFPLQRPLFFAPKSFWSKFNNGNNSWSKSQSSLVGTDRPRSPPAFPMIYGACRKGASIYPRPANMRHLVRHKDKKKNRKKSQERAPSTTCQPGTSADEPNSNSKRHTTSSVSSISSSSTAKLTSNKTTSSSELPEKIRHSHTKIKIRTNGRRHRTKRLRSDSSIHRSSGIEDSCSYSSAGEEVDGENNDDNESETTAVDACLEKVIPMPENFEGHNNPFYDINNDGPRKSSSSETNLRDNGDLREGHSSSTPASSNGDGGQHFESGYQIIRSGTCSKLTLKRITGQPIEKESDLTKEFPRQILKSPGTVENPNDVLPKSEMNPRKCIIKAQRITADGKLEYLLEWE